MLCPRCLDNMFLMWDGGSITDALSGRVVHRIEPQSTLWCMHCKFELKLPGVVGYKDFARAMLEARKLFKALKETTHGQ